MKSQAHYSKTCTQLVHEIKVDLKLKLEHCRSIICTSQCDTTVCLIIMLSSFPSCIILDVILFISLLVFLEAK